MTPEEAYSIAVNGMLNDNDLAEIEKLEKATAPGEWYAHGEGVRRFDGTPVTDPNSVSFMAMAKAIVPRLVKHAAHLERAWKTAKAEATSWKAECTREREAHRLAMERAAEGKGGPPEDVEALARALSLGVHVGDARYLRLLLERWLQGASIRADVEPQTVRAERERTERRELQDATCKSQHAALEALVGAPVTDDHAFIVREAIFAFLASDKGKAALRTYLAKHHPTLLRR